MNALRRIAFALLILPLSALVASETIVYDDPDLYRIPCGKVTEIKLSAKSDFGLNWEIRKYKEEPALESNEKFVEVVVTVASGFSIGKHDFELTGNPCLAITTGTEPYNPELQQVIADGGEKTVKLLFKGIIDAKVTSFNLTYKYSTKDALSESLPEELKRVQLDIVKSKPAAKEDPAPKKDDGEKTSGEKTTKKTKRIPKTEKW